MGIKYTDEYNRKLRSWTRNNYSDTQYGFEGVYTHKNLGECLVDVCQDSKESYYLILTVWKNGQECYRSILCSGKPTHRSAGLKALQFLKELLVMDVTESLE